MTPGSERGDVSGTTDLDLVLLRLGADAGGRIDPARILRRKPESQSRRSFVALMDAGYVDGEGWITKAGFRALRGLGT